MLVEQPIDSGPKSEDPHTSARRSNAALPLHQYCYSSFIHLDSATASWLHQKASCGNVSWISFADAIIIYECCTSSMRGYS